MDILLTMIKEDLITKEMQTVYIYTKRISLSEGANGALMGSNKDHLKTQQVTFEVEVKAIDGLNENIMIQIRSIDASNDIFLS